MLKYYTPETLLLATEEPNVLDIRPREFFNNGHVKNACWIDPNNPIEIIELNFKPSEQLILYDNSDCDITAETVATALEERGYTKTYILQGGYAGWVEFKLKRLASFTDTDVKITELAEMEQPLSKRFKNEI